MLLTMRVGQLHEVDGWNGAGICVAHVNTMLGTHAAVDGQRQQVLESPLQHLPRVRAAIESRLGFL